MDIKIPSTREEMVNTLEEIYYFFRREKAVYEEIEFIPLNLWRMDEKSKTEEELESEAKLNLSAEHLREIKKESRLILDEIELTKEKIAELKTLEEEELKLTDEEFEENKADINSSASKNGLTGSDVVAIKIFDLYKEKNCKKAEIKQKYFSLKVELSAKIKLLEEKLELVPEYYSDIHLAEVEKEKKKLKKEDEERVAVASRFNSGIDEKEQEYKNKILETNAKIKIDFLSIENRDYSKEELIQMGYYKSVVKCVSGYFNKLEALEAYHQFCDETRLVYYLDHYYETMLNSYRIKAISN